MVVSFSPIKKSAFYHRQVSMGARMVDRDGWLQTAFYSGVEQETRVMAESVGVFDVSPSGKLQLQSNDVGDLLKGKVLSGNAPAIGTVRQVSLLARGTLARLTADECLLLCELAEIPKWTSLLSEVLDGCGHLVDHTSGLAGVRLTGPRSSDLLSKLSEFDTSPDSFSNLACAQARFAEIHGTIMRTDLGPLLSYDLFFPREFGEYAWTAIFEAGEEFGVAAVGFEATDQLRPDPAMTPT